MNLPRKVVCLDLSTSAGYAVFETEDVKPRKFAYGVHDGYRLVKIGTVALPKKVTEYGAYPWCYLAAAKALVFDLMKEVEFDDPNVIVIEETNKGRNRYSQKTLEFIHKEILEIINSCRKDWMKEGVDDRWQVVYLDTSEWRKVLGLKMDKAQKKANAKLRKAMRTAREKGGKVDKKQLGIKGLVTPKHVALNYANTTFNLTLRVKDNDIADAICLGMAYFKGATHCNGV